MKCIKKKKLGLVFSGGGAKGAYLLGVWKAMKDLGLDHLVEGVSGTSIGALTAYMFAIKDYEQASMFWELSKKEEMDKYYSKTKRIFNKIIGKNNQIALENLTHNLYLSSNKIDYLLDSVVNEAKLNKSQCQCYITCHNLLEGAPETFLLNTYQKEDIKKILKASASMPVLFKKVKMKDKIYYDGGISLNTPILPLYQNDYNVIIVVYLAEKGHYDYRMFPNSYFIEITPKTNIGHFRDGVLNFNKSKIERLIKQGYNDAYSVLQHYLELLNKPYL